MDNLNFYEIMRLSQSWGLINDQARYTLTEKTSKEVSAVLGNKLEQIAKDAVNHVFTVIRDETPIEMGDFVMEAALHIAGTEKIVRDWVRTKDDSVTPPIVYAVCVAGFVKDYAIKKGLMKERGYTVYPTVRPDAVLTRAS
jgi:hypothetical protein